MDPAPRQTLDSTERGIRLGLAGSADLPRLLESASIESRKEFVRAFVGGITVRPDTGVLDVQMRQLPVLGAANSACEMVAGARYEPVQIELIPVERFAPARTIVRVESCASVSIARVHGMVNIGLPLAVADA
jgi:hypothetical protein